MQSSYMYILKDNLQDIYKPAWIILHIKINKYINYLHLYYIRSLY